MLHTSTLTISVGRNVADVPMSDALWLEFRCAIDTALERIGATLHFYGEGEGYYLGAIETSYTWIASVNSAHIWLVRRELAPICAQFSQDCIALTVGNTEFVGG